MSDLTAARAERDKAEIAALKARIAELEDYLEELAPFHTAAHIDMNVKIQGRGQDEAEIKGWAFKRDTLYLDHRLLWKAKRLLDKREGVLPSGA